MIAGFWYKTVPRVLVHGVEPDEVVEFSGLARLQDVVIEVWLRNWTRNIYSPVN